MQRTVTPHAGVWIETANWQTPAVVGAVTPHAGVWIETQLLNEVERVLGVTPHAGVWIETSPAIHAITLACHSPRGSVD